MNKKQKKEVVQTVKEYIGNILFNIFLFVLGVLLIYIGFISATHSNTLSGVVALCVGLSGVINFIIGVGLCFMIYIKLVCRNE